LDKSPSTEALKILVLPGASTKHFSYLSHQVSFAENSAAKIK
jgi:hypothetical protein